VAVDNQGNVYIADTGNGRIRKVDASGIITTVAGSGNGFNLGDGGPATSAQLANPSDVVVDGAGNLYIADYGNSRVRKVNTAGTISSVTGLNLGAAGLAVDTAGNHEA
jgi:sugar lactone lactonase YvrE